jgi:AraC-like DNA-binding protein
MLLANPQLSGTGIAFAVDYETLSVFAASLPNTIGVTPSHFRHSL